MDSEYYDDDMFLDDQLDAYADDDMVKYEKKLLLNLIFLICYIELVY
jgi:hypothetical protein